MTSEPIRILLVDDEERLLEALAKGLTTMGYAVETNSSAQAALETLKKKSFHVLVTDLVMPEMNGMQLLALVKESHAGLPVIILTGHGTIPGAVTAMQSGAFNFITKPYNLDEVDANLKKAAEHASLIAENQALREQVEKRLSYANIIGESSAMQKVFKIIDRVKDTRSTVLITGESGTGKELAAKALHFSGFLKDKAFVTVDCASLTESLLESELFGHVRGAFTGAHKDHDGYFEAAHKGTIFLDEIGEFSPGLQTRMLRVLQEGEFTRVGDIKTRKVDVRVIAATNRDLESAVADGRFREDLFYRLNVITILMPPLRDRVEDIPVLINYFLQKFNKKLGKRVMRVSPDAMEIFMNYPWPGNVRELENMMERLITFCDDDVLKAIALPDEVKSKASEVQEEQRQAKTLIAKTYKDAKSDILERFTVEYVEALLQECDGKITRAANRSGMDRGCFYRLMKKYGIDKEGVLDD
jgi:two-component system response regulator AtoC